VTRNRIKRRLRSGAPRARPAARRGSGDRRTRLRCPGFRGGFRAWLRRVAGRIAKEGQMTRVLSLPLLAVLWLYRKLISPALPPACRYYPSCSQYAQEAVRVHGPNRRPLPRPQTPAPLPPVGRGRARPRAAAHAKENRMKNQKPEPARRRRHLARLHGRAVRLLPGPDGKAHGDRAEAAIPCPGAGPSRRPGGEPSPGQRTCRSSQGTGSSRGTSTPRPPCASDLRDAARTVVATSEGAAVQSILLLGEKWTPSQGTERRGAGRPGPRARRRTAPVHDRDHGSGRQRAGPGGDLL